MLRFSLSASRVLLRSPIGAGSHRCRPAGLAKYSITASAGESQLEWAPGEGATNVLIDEFNFKMNEIRKAGRKANGNSKIASYSATSKNEIVEDLVRLAAECDEKAPLAPAELKDLLLSLSMSLRATHRSLSQRSTSDINRIVARSLKQFSSRLNKNSHEIFLGEKNLSKNTLLYEIVKGLSTFKMKDSRGDLQLILLQCVMRITKLTVTEDGRFDFDALPLQKHLIQNASKFVKNATPKQHALRIKAQQYLEETLKILTSEDDVTRTDAEIQEILHTVLARLKLSSQAGVSMRDIENRAPSLLTTHPSRLLHLCYETGHHSTEYPGQLLSRCLLTFSHLNMVWSKSITPEVEQGMFGYLKMLSSGEDYKVPPMSHLTATKTLFSLGKLLYRTRSESSGLRADIGDEVVQNLLRIVLTNVDLTTPEDAVAKKGAANHQAFAKDMNKLDFLEAVDGFARTGCPINKEDWELLSSKCYEFIKDSNFSGDKKVEDKRGHASSKHAHVLIWALGKIMYNSKHVQPSLDSSDLVLEEKYHQAMVDAARHSLKSLQLSQTKEKAADAAPLTNSLPLKIVPITLSSLHHLGISWRGSALGDDLEASMKLGLDATDKYRDISEILVYLTKTQPLTSSGGDQTENFTLEDVSPELRACLFDALQKINNESFGPIHRLQVRSIDRSFRSLNCTIINMTNEEAAIVDGFTKKVAEKQKEFDAITEAKNKQNWRMQKQRASQQGNP